MKCLIYESDSHSASHNLAVEEFLFGLADREGCAILYLWQNEKAVVLGKNQDAYAEVNMDAVEKFNIQVVRRMTGGGTVFHDMGNLNYTMLFPNAYENKDFVYRIVLGAFGSLGIEVYLDGRNDICIDGFKFSGNAFYTNGNSYLHHGTILVESDLDMMDAVLNTPSGKMAGRSVRSVQARVKNIKDVLPNITVDKIRMEIKREYEKWANSVFGMCLEKIQIKESDLGDFLKKYNNPLWNIGDGKQYEFNRTVRFEWGNAQIAYNQRNGIVTDAKIYTDSLEVEGVENVERALKGKSI